MGLTPEELDRQIKEARAKQEQETNPLGLSKAANTAEGTAGKAVRVTSEMAAALIVGGVLGFWLDKWLNTKPMFMIVLFFAGFAAGFMNILRMQNAEKQGPATGDGDKEKKEK